MAHHVQCNYCQMFPPVWSRALTQALVTGPSKSLDPDSGTVCRLHCVSLTRQSASSRNCWRLVSWRSSSTVARARRGLRCTILLEHKVVTRHCAYRWQQYDVIMTSWSSIKDVSKRYHHNFLLFNTMNLPHALQIYSTVFVKKCMRLHFWR